METPDAPLAAYAAMREAYDHAHQACTRNYPEADMTMVATRKGGVVLDIKHAPAGGVNLTVERLRAIRNAITDWLVTVAGDEALDTVRFWKTRYEEEHRNSQALRKELATYREQEVLHGNG